MTEAQEYERKRWIGLALLCMAQFVVVLDASIVNVALPTIGSATLTIDASRTTTNCATQRRASPIHRLRSYACASVIS